MAGDGIYSLHVGPLRSPGRYSLVFEVDDNDNRTFVALLPNTNGGRQGDSPIPCCGSTVALNPEQTEETGVFRRTLIGPTFHVFDTYGAEKSGSRRRSEPPKDLTPPNRIGDLSVKLLSGSNNLLATWTAPGGDFNQGSVASYRFVYSEDIADLLDPTRRPKILLAFDRMETAGTDSSYDFEFPHYDTDYYVGAYGFDIAGNRGKISNLVHVRVPSPPSQFSAAGEDGSDASSSSPIFSLSGGTNSDLDWIMIGVIAGVVGVLLILSIVAISYYVFVARNGIRRRNKGEGETAAGIIKAGGGSGASGPSGGSSSSTDETDSSSFDSDIKNIMLANPPLGPALPLSTGATNPASSLPPHVALHHGGGHHHLSAQPHLSAHHQHTHLSAAALAGSGGDSGVGTHGDPTPTNSDQQAVTPVYWSASQLLSKLDHGEGGVVVAPATAGNYSPYVTSAAAAGDYSCYHPAVQPGPHSLQYPVGSAYALDGSRSEWSAAGAPSSYQQHQIPEEFTITVGNLQQQQQQTSSSTDDAASRKVPPPVMPKPRNITQV